MGAVREFSGRVRRAASGDTVAELRRRIEVLEEEVQECRTLNRRIAELTDVVAELLLPATQRDEAALREALARYSDSL